VSFLSFLIKYELIILPINRILKLIKNK